MRKFVVILISIVFFLPVSGQSKFITKSGFISFYSHTSMEDIKAENNQVASILDTESGEILFTVLMKSFRFERALMEEHFNENYVESDKYPKASFKGKITNLSAINFKKQGTYNADLEGDMTIHGVTKHITEKGTFEVNEKIAGKAKFKLNVVDYEIVIPSVVKDKFADSFEINVNMDYSPLKK